MREICVITRRKQADMPMSNKYRSMPLNLSRSLCLTWKWKVGEVRKASTVRLALGSQALLTSTFGAGEGGMVGECVCVSV